VRQGPARAPPSDAPIVAKKHAKKLAERSGNDGSQLHKTETRVRASAWRFEAELFRPSVRELRFSAEDLDL
jgi:hypothetical protein